LSVFKESINFKTKTEYSKKESVTKEIKPPVKPKHHLRDSHRNLVKKDRRMNNDRE